MRQYLVTHVFPSATYRHTTCDIHACKEELVFGPHLHTPPGICNIYQMIIKFNLFYWKIPEF